MSKSEIVQFRASKELIDRIDELANSENKTRADFIRERLKVEVQKKVVVQPIQLIPCLSIKMNEPEPPKIEEIVLKLDESKRNKVMRKLILEQYYDVSYDCYFYFIISYVSALTGSTYEEYIRDHLKDAKKFPKMEDVWRNFKYMGKYETEYAIEILVENGVKNVSQFDKYVAKIKERCKEQIEKYVRSNDSKPI